MATLTIVYFAWVREAIGRDEEQVERAQAGATVADLVAMLAARGGKAEEKVKIHEAVVDSGRASRSA